jgi:hypothetical protein
VSRRHTLPVVGLVVIALLTAAVVVLASTIGGGGESSAPKVPSAEIAPGNARPPGTGLPRTGIQASGTIEPRIILFGDTITARVDVLLDRRRVDPASVRVGGEFLPWELVGTPTRTRTDSGPNTRVETTFMLRCTGSPCLPGNVSTALDFTPARVSYARPSAGPGERSAMRVAFPILLLYSRFAAANAVSTAGPPGQNLWRADLTSFPAASYRLAPGVLVPTLLVLAVLLAAAGAVLAFVAVPRRKAVPEPEPEPEPEPVIVLTPLEQALELLVDASRADGAQDRRRALELVAEVLDLEHPELARTARTLAWSEDDPLVEQTSGLATRVRATIATIGNGTGNGNGSGREP